MRQSTLLRILTASFLLSSQHVQAVDLDKCVGFCASKLAFPNCMTFCRFFHRTPTEGGPIDLEEADNNGEGDLDMDGGGLHSGGNDEEVLLDDNDEKDKYQIVSRFDVSSSPSISPENENNSAPTGSPPQGSVIAPGSNAASAFPSDSPSLMPTSTTTTLPPAQVPTPLHVDYADVMLPTQPTSAPVAPTLSPISPTRPPRAPTVMPTAFDNSNATTGPTSNFVSDGLVNDGSDGNSTDSTAAPESPPTKESINPPVQAPPAPTSDTAGDDPPSDAPVTKTSPLPDCLWDKKVAYQCGRDTFVCNSDEVFTALEVCDQQPVPQHGGIFEWKDTGGDTCTKEVKTRDIDADCWCKNMEVGVTTSHGNSAQESFSPHVLCPNYDYVTSYVCYFPRLGGASYKVNRQLKDSNNGEFVERCTGFQSRNELPPVQMPTAIVYEAP